MSFKTNCSQEAMLPMILFKIAINHSNAAARNRGTKSAEANSITTIPKAIMTLKNGITTTLVIKNKPENWWK